MSKWNISELDQQKTEQSIANEKIRLDNCRQELDKTIISRERFAKEMNEKLRKYDEKILSLTNSIYSGEKFLEDCQNHLKDFE